MTFNNFAFGSPRFHDNECYNLELRYCGDGVLDSGDGEVCDPMDPSRTGHGNGGCDTNMCQPINNPTCNGLSVNLNSGENPQDVVATCEGFNVDTFQIDCGNGQVFTGAGNGSGTQTFARTCNYTDAGNFTPVCTINGSITNNSCRQEISITNPNPSIVIDKRDANVFDQDGNVGNDTQTVFTGEEATFRIRVTNNGGEALENIILTDAVAPLCATRAGTFVNLSGASFRNTSNGVVPVSFGGPGNHSNSILEV